MQQEQNMLPRKLNELRLKLTSGLILGAVNSILLCHMFIFQSLWYGEIGVQFVHVFHDWKTCYVKSIPNGNGEYLYH